MNYRTRRHHDRSGATKMIPNPELYVHRRKVNANTVPTSSISLNTISKRPVQCPHKECNKFVSIFNVESHFVHEHKEVPIIFTQMDTRNALEIFFRDLRCGIVQCIALLTLNRHGRLIRTTEYMRSQGDVVNDSNPVLVLLATRISSYQIPDCVHSSHNKTNILADEASTTKLSSNDKIIIWVASNVATNLSYTVAVSTLTNDIRVKYYGPLYPIGDIPEELCCEGKCLILSPFHCRGMSSNWAKPVALDVVLHNDDEDEKSFPR